MIIKKCKFCTHKLINGVNEINKLWYNCWLCNVHFQYDLNDNILNILFQKDDCYLNISYEDRFSYFDVFPEIIFNNESISHILINIESKHICNINPDNFYKIISKHYLQNKTIEQYRQHIIKLNIIR